MKAALALFFALAACIGPAGPDDAAGNRLEAAALEAGLIPAAAAVTTGVWARDGNRLCLGPPGGEGRAALLVDDGAGNRCVYVGTATRSGQGVELTARRCRLPIRLAGSQAVLPDEIDAACTRLCRGGASPSGLTLDRLSDASAEAAAFRLPRGGIPCAD